MILLARAFSPSLGGALQLDPLSAEAHASMGLVYCRDRAWGEAETAFRRAIQLNPNLPRSRQDFATSVLLPLGRLEEAVRELQIALKLDPLFLNVLNSLDFVLVSAGRYDEVLDNCHRVLTVAPDDIFAEQLSGRALLQKGRLNEGIAIFEKQGESGGPGFLGFAYILPTRICAVARGLPVERVSPEAMSYRETIEARTA
jgi:tetratricopeptide (TPR) repeat protein